MAKTITVQISDRDYDDLVRHLAEQSAGRALVGVIQEMGGPGSFLSNDVVAARRAIAERAQRAMIAAGRDEDDPQPCAAGRA